MTLFNNLHPVEVWQTESRVLAICGTGWVRTHLKQTFPGLTTDKRLMNFDDKENDPLLLNLVVVNLSEFLFFSQDAEIAGDFVNVGVIYSNLAWKDSVCAYAK